MGKPEIKYDTPIEVTAEQYRKIMNACGGIVAGAVIEGKYFIKVWMMGYKHYVTPFLGN